LSEKNVFSLLITNYLTCCAMKKLSYSLTLLLLFGFLPLQAQFDSEGITADWSIVGSAGFTSAQADFTDIEVDNNGVIYVAMADNFSMTSQDEILIWKYENNAWDTLGGSLVGNAFSLAMDLGPDGTPYIVYENSSLDCYKWENNAWVELGATVNGSGGGDVDIAVDGNGDAFVVFRTSTDLGLIRKFDPAFNTWTLLGGGIYNTGTGPSFDNKIFIDDGGNPVVVYRTGPSENQLSTHVAQYDGSAWSAVGPNFGRVDANVLTNSTFHKGLVDENGNLLVALSEGNNDQFLNIYSYDGSNWTKTHSNVSNGEADYVDFEITSQGYLVVAYRDGNDQASVQQYRDGVWGPVGQLGFSGSLARNLSLALGADDVPYVAYGDEGFNRQLTVQINGTLDNSGLFDEIRPTLALDVFPNPTRGNFTLRMAGLRDVQYQVSDLLGHMVLSAMIQNPSGTDISQEINLPPGLTPGIYFLKVYSGEKHGRVKLMVE
jgi:hypothetical protein